MGSLGTWCVLPDLDSALPNMNFRGTSRLDAVIQWDAGNDQFFLNLIKRESPDISPSIFMTDRDQAQVNAIRGTYYPSSHVFYCWWHVLRAIRCHFVVTEFQELWTLIQKWVRTTDQYEFDAWWEDIQNDRSVPQSLAEYLAREWVPVKEMWSAVFCQSRRIFEEGDTNMLLESYVIRSYSHTASKLGLGITMCSNQNG
jgi:hypothetical protein